jgi:PEP-CTERM motif
MKASQIFAVALLLVVGSALAFANSMDPQVIIHGVGSGGGAPVVCPPSGCTGVGEIFHFVVPPTTPGHPVTFFFTNTSGVNWTSLALIETCKKGVCLVPASAITCHSYLFSSCTPETLKNGNVEILLSNTSASTSGPFNRAGGIRNNQSFSITFSCLGKGCWPGPGLKFTGDANGASVPEPGTIALMMTGLGTLVSRRKLWKNRWNS